MTKVSAVPWVTMIWWRQSRGDDLLDCAVGTLGELGYGLRAWDAFVVVHPLAYGRRKDEPVVKALLRSAQAMP